ncbi:unnamed protein product [Hyaloperonospora brassicae]|uniref:Uncharacterized protein n=1 Tax=Hyaloperonospora brassicae TaxID=162125 RepID=A0AAV0UQM0_HYABA|nr:unnamed protein product [Hyaloperonospora brassicae]
MARTSELRPMRRSVRGRSDRSGHSVHCRRVSEVQSRRIGPRARRAKATALRALATQRHPVALRRLPRARPRQVLCKQPQHALVGGAAARERRGRRDESGDRRPRDGHAGLGLFFVLNESSVDLSNVTVALTSTAGETITDSLSLTPGKCTPGTSNFGPSRRVKVLNNFDELTYDSDYKAGDVMAMDEEALAPPARPAATTSDAHLLLVAPVVLAAVCAVAWGAFAYVARRAKATPTDESNSLTSPFSTRSSPAILSDTMTRL